MSQQKLERTDCWCYATKRQVYIIGLIVGRRQADLLEVTDCVGVVDSVVDTKKCPQRFAVDCRIGKLVEGRW